MKKAVEQLKAAAAASTGTSSQALTDAVTTLQSQLAALSTETGPAMIEGKLLVYHYQALHLNALRRQHVS